MGFPILERAVNADSGQPATSPVAEDQFTPPATEAGGSFDGSTPPGDDNPDGAGSQVGNEGAEDRERFIPRERFDEVNEFKRQYEPFVEALRPILSQYGSVEEFQAAIRQAEEQQRQAEIQTYASRVDDELGELVATGQIAEELAPTIREMILQQQQLAPLAEQFQRFQQEQAFNASVAGLKTRYPNMDEQAVRYAWQAGGNPEAEAKRTHDRIEAQVAQRLRGRQALTNAVQPETGGSSLVGTPPATIPDPVNDPKGFEAYLAKVKRGLGGGGS